jgi:hypothetical protein
MPTSGANAPITTASKKFPRCDAAVGKMENGEWALADAILAECSEPGENGVRNGSQAKMEAMRDEIAGNHGVDLSLERIRKLRKVASAFPPGRRRPGVSLESHLEASTPEVLDEIMKGAPKGTALSREYVRQAKNSADEAGQPKQDEKTKQKDEQRHQAKDEREALQNVCRNLEQQIEQLRHRNAELCRTNGLEPEPLAPPLAPKDQPPLNVTGDLEQGLRVLLISRGFDPAADNVKQAMADFVKAVLAKAQ